MLFRRAHDAVVVERRTLGIAARLKSRQLRHHEQRDFALQGQRLQVPQHERHVFVLRRPRFWRRDELEVVHDDEADLAQRIEALERRLEVLAGEGQQREREAAQAHRPAAPPMPARVCSLSLAARISSIATRPSIASARSIRRSSFISPDKYATPNPPDCCAARSATPRANADLPLPMSPPSKIKSRRRRPPPSSLSSDPNPVAIVSPVTSPGRCASTRA